MTKETYDKYAYDLYRDAFSELRDTSMSRELVFQVFSDADRMGITDEEMPEFLNRNVRLRIREMLRLRNELDGIWLQLEDRRHRESERKPAWDHRITYTGDDRYATPAPEPEAETKTDEASMSDLEIELEEEKHRHYEDEWDEVQSRVGHEPEEEEETAEVHETEEKSYEDLKDLQPEFSGEEEEKISEAFIREDSPAQEDSFVRADTDVKAALDATEEALERAAAEVAPEEMGYAGVDEEEEAPEEAEEEEEEKTIDIIGGGITASEEREVQSRAIREANEAEKAEAAVVSEPVSSGGGFFQAFFSILLFIVIAILIWLVLNILMYAGVIPKMDFGYTWFNENVFPMFWI